MPAVRRKRRRQEGGLGPFAQQLAMFSLAPIVTDMASNVLNSMVPGLTGQAGGKFSLPDNSQMIGLPYHLPLSTYLRVPRPKQKGGGIRKKMKCCKQKSQQGGLGPLAAMAGMALAPLVLKPLLTGLQQ